MASKLQLNQEQMHEKQPFLDFLYQQNTEQVQVNSRSITKRAELTSVYPLQLLIMTKSFSFANFDHVLSLLSLDGAVDVMVPNRAVEQVMAFRIGLDVKPSENILQRLELWLAQQGAEQALLDGSEPVLDAPGVLVMDMDSTVIAMECIDEIAKLAGVGEQVAEVTAKAMRGELDFEASLRARVATLKGADESILQQVGKSMPLMPGVENLVSQLLKHDWRVLIASGGFTYFSSILQKQLGLTDTFANQLVIDNGKLTGEVAGRVVDANVKAEILIDQAKVADVEVRQTMAMGDGANDLTMLGAAGLGVACHAKPLVRQKARVSIDALPLDCALFMLN